uniref:C3H1-type domain-containing protein n=1 Tax=Hyaloperonospora arabidopsidis (strain Emoy2) TaxID=559515 RepID=M4BZ18_HYAAE
MAAAPGLPVDSASVDAVNDAPTSTEQQLQQQTALIPETGELLSRVATEVSQAFQTSLVQVREKVNVQSDDSNCNAESAMAGMDLELRHTVMSDIGREYGVESSRVKFARMEKGDAAVASGDEQLLGKPGRDDVRRLSHELELLRLQVRQLQQVVDEQHDEQRLSQQKVALLSTLARKLKRDLVDERLALVNAKNEIQELRRRRSRDDVGSGTGECARSPHSPSVQEPTENPWTSPNESIAGPASGVSGSGATAGAAGGSSLLTFDFYPSTSSRGGNDPEGADEEEGSSPSSTTQTLRHSCMDQFLPSALLDSPQVTPRHAKSFVDDTLDEEKAPPPFEQGADDLQSPLLPVPAPALSGDSLTTSATVKRQSLNDGEGDGRNETSHGGSARVATPFTKTPVKLSMLSEVFDAVPIKELKMILRRFDDQESAAIDYILSTHPSLNPVNGARRTGEGGSSLASMTSPPPSRSSIVGHNKTITHRSSNPSGPIEPPPGSVNNWKTEICMYYMQGKCNKTRRTCSFAHGESDLVRPSGLSSNASSSKHVPSYKTRSCQAYENGTCAKSRRDCPMAHGMNDLRDGGSVSGGSGGSQAVVPPATPRLQSYKTELCYYFLKGNCNYSKEECRFAHGQNDLRTVEGNTAQMAAAASGSSFGSDFSPSSPVPPPPPVSMEKQLQLQYQYQQQYQQHHQPLPAAPFELQPPPAQQPNFVPQHQIQLQQSSRGGGGQHQFGFQHQPYDPAQQHQQYMAHPGGQYRYLKTMEDKRPTLAGRLPRRDSGSSWSSFDATGLPPSEY